MLKLIFFLKKKNNFKKHATLVTLLPRTSLLHAVSKNMKRSRQGESC